MSSTETYSFRIKIVCNSNVYEIEGGTFKILLTLPLSVFPHIEHNMNSFDGKVYRKIWLHIKFAYHIIMLISLNIRQNSAKPNQTFELQIFHLYQYAMCTFHPRVHKPNEMFR